MAAERTVIAETASFLAWLTAVAAVSALFAEFSEQFISVNCFKISQGSLEVVSASERKGLAENFSCYIACSIPFLVRIIFITKGADVTAAHSFLSRTTLLVAAHNFITPDHNIFT